jgi:integrase
MKLTAKAVEKLRHNPSKGRQQDIKDNGTPGLYLRLYQTGRKSWIYRYKLRGKVRILTLGDGKQVGLAEARKLARQAHDKVKIGTDPAAEAQRIKAEILRMPTIEAFALEYIERYAQPNKKSWPEDQRLLRREVVPIIGKLRLDQIHRRDIVALLDSIRDRGAQVLSNRVLAVVRRMFGFAIERGIIEVNPVIHIKAFRETPRERTLSDEEIRHLWKATEPDAPLFPSTRLALRLALLTGQRAGEICGMKREELDLEKALWALPGARTKNGLPHAVPLSTLTLRTVSEALTYSWSKQWVFPARRGGNHLTVYALDQAMQRIFDGTLSRPTPHDIRRTVGTRLGELGFNRIIQDKILNHKDRTVGGIYDRHSYDCEKRQALGTWEHQLQKILDSKRLMNVIDNFSQ